MKRCETCGRALPLHLLDVKPESLKGIKATHEMLDEAAERGEDFPVLECKSCYGPAWEEGIKDA